MKKTQMPLKLRLLAAANWVERVDSRPKFHRAIYYFLAVAAGFFGKVIIDILAR